MSLSNWLKEEILKEEKKVDKVIAIYPGRYQPFGKHHAEVFKWVQNKFGKDNSYIATSDKVQLPKSPFSFKEKKKIINKYGIKNVVQVKNPYQATEITKKFDPETTAVVFIVGGKEEGRLKPGKYFREWEGKAEYGWGEHAYITESPVIKLSVPGHGDMSGTTIRKSLGNPNIDDDERMDLFKGIFGHKDKGIYKLVTDKLIDLNEVMTDFVINNKLDEVSTAASGLGQEVDDGPKGYWGDERSYENYNEFLALNMGMEVLSYLTGQEVPYVYDKYKTDYPNGPVDAVTYFPAGDVDSVGAGTQYIELRGTPAYDAWVKHIEKVAHQIGWTFVHDLKSKDLAIKHSENEPNKEEEKVISMEDQNFDGMLDEGKISENPDIVYDEDGKEIAKFSTTGAMPFGYFYNKMFVGNQGEVHGHMHKKSEAYNNYFINFGRNYGVDRGSFDFPGRMWTKHKIISFWRYPVKSKIKNLVKDIEKESGVKIWGNGWKVEVYPGKKQINNSDNIGSILVPLEKYNGSKLPPGGDVDHAKSPMLKKKKQVPKCVGSKKTPKGGSKNEPTVKTHARMRMDWWNKEELDESPDTAWHGDKRLYYTDPQAKPFAYFGKKFIVGDYGEGHNDVAMKAGPMLRTYDGRIWTNDKVISFWQYPKQSEIKKFVKMIEKQAKIKIWNNKWMIEVSSDKTGHIDIHKTEKYGTRAGLPVLIPVEDYSDKDEMEFDKSLHIASPMLKKKMIVPKGVGSRKIPTGGSKDEPTAKTHARMRMDHIEVDESINIDVEVGDTIMTGRFKNSPTVVKSIGKDKYGMPTINGRKVVTFKKGKKRANIFDENLFTKDWWDNIVEEITEEYDGPRNKHNIKVGDKILLFYDKKIDKYWNNEKETVTVTGLDGTRVRMGGDNKGWQDFNKLFVKKIK